jgi:nuclear pore complex protein Nup53
MSLFQQAYGTPSSLSHGRPQQQHGGSPPGQMDTSGYLPAFLLGSPTPKSPARSRHAVAGTTPRLQGLRASTSFQTDRGAVMVGSGGRKIHSEGTASKPTRVGGPPVQGLYDQPKSPARTSTPLYIGSPERRQLNFSLVQTANRTGHRATPSTNALIPPTPGIVGVTGVREDGVTQISPPCPPQLDPFYSQGESLDSGDGPGECWVTVFGFPPPASSYVLEQFSQYGTILRHSVSADGNWMHLLFQSRLQAKKALSKNGKVYGNGIMIGVQPCIDKAVMEGYVPGAGDGATARALGGGGGASSGPLGSSGRPATIRPLTAAYQASSGPNQVNGGERVS